MKKLLHFSVLLIILACSSVYGQTYWGSGSRDLNYSADGKGNRAYMISSSCNNCAFNPFPQNGTVYVYAKVGETIHVASNVKGLRGVAGEIRLFPPNGRSTNTTKYYSSGTVDNNTGRIESSDQEKIGPNIAVNPNSNRANGFIPFSQVVAPGEEGIWVINFHSQGTNTTQAGMDTAVNSTWFILPTDSAFIAAWDVTVSSSTEIKSGRAFIKNFNGSIYPNDSGADEDGFYGKFYVLTYDGFAYLIDNNGQNGLSFNSFVNNSGTVLNPTQLKVQDYQSFNGSSYNTVSGKLYDPRKMDDYQNRYITHKMFYGKPGLDMPEESEVFYWDVGASASDISGTNGSTQKMWLRPERIEPIIENISFVGTEGTLGQAGAKGGYLYFESNTFGKYEITIPFPGTIYTERIITGETTLGLNRVYWDGFDGSGVRVLVGTSISAIKTKLSGAELHFPFIDVENNPYGVKIERLKADYTFHTPSDYEYSSRNTVYWNVNGLSGTNLHTTNLNNSTVGADSSLITGNLRWGTKNTGTNNFGNDKGIVIWTYALGEQFELDGINIEVKAYDLEVVNVALNSSSANLSDININDTFGYSTKIKNNGPEHALGIHNAIFQFYLPSGVSYESVTFQSSNGAVLQNSSVQEITTIPGFKIYKASVDMPSGSEGVFTINARLTSPTPTGKINAWSTIMRNNDCYDPNATNPDYLFIARPTDPFQEANGIYKKVEELSLHAVNSSGYGFPISALDGNSSNLSTATNNIKVNNALISKSVASTTLTIKKTGFRATNGGATTFYITVKNIGLQNSTNTVMTDVLGSFNVNLTGTPLNINSSDYYIPKGSVSYIANPKNLVWNIGTLLPGEEVTMSFKSNNGSNSYENIAKAKSNEAQEVTASVTVNTNTSNIDASITKTVSRETGTGKAIFTIKFDKPNNSSNNYTATVVDYLPKGYVIENQTTDITFSGNGNSTYTYNPTTNQIVWNISMSGSTASRSMQIKAKLMSASSQVDYTNKAQITYTSQTDNNLANNTAEAKIKSDLSVSKRVNNATPYINDEVVFTIEVSNQDISNAYFDAYNVEVQDLLPSGYQFVSATTSSGTFSNGTGLWKIGTLGISQTVSLQITAKVKSSGNYMNIASVSSVVHDDNLSNNVDVATIIPRKKAYLISNPMIYTKIK